MRFVIFDFQKKGNPEKINLFSQAVKILIFFLFISLFSSCSLKYGNTPVVEDKTPEFVFSGVDMIRYENKKKKIELKADTIEQYKDISASYIKGVKFKSYDDKNELSTEGSCGYLLLDKDKEIYELYDGIKLFSKSKDATVIAKSLRWNGKNEQLVSGRGENVRIEKDDIVIFGSGFSASGVGGEYSFTGMVSGNIDTQENKSNDEETSATGEINENK